MNALSINGLKVDAQPIADGLYEIICAQGDEAIVAFGMIPKPIIDLAEKLIREKVIDAEAEVIDQELKAGREPAKLMARLMREAGEFYQGELEHGEDYV